MVSLACSTSQPSRGMLRSIMPSTPATCGRAERSTNSSSFRPLQRKKEDLTQLHRHLRKEPATPLVAVRRKSRGHLWQQAGTIATSPKEIDAIIRNEYGAIYRGTAKKGEGPKAFADAYVERYRPHIFHQPEMTIEAITGEDVYQAVQALKATAGGMDQWDPADLKMLSKGACSRLADFYNAIEAGAPWPKQLTTARAAFLAKEEDSDLDPMDYRVLLMLASSYRLWGKIRLAHLKPWISNWDKREIYAGIEGKGAADAAYATAMEIEYCRLTGTPYTGGAADIYKCFDKVRRDIVYRLLEEAGMPKQLASTYRNFLEALTVRNTVAGGLGRATPSQPRSLKAALWR